MTKRRSKAADLAARAQPAVKLRPVEPTEATSPRVLLDRAATQLATSPEAALRAILAAWALVRSPRLAACCERAGRLVERPPLRRDGVHAAVQTAWLELAAAQDPGAIPRLLETLTTGSGKDAAARIDALAWADDPRVATALAELLVRRPYRGTMAHRPEAAVLRRLAALADPRTREALAARSDLPAATLLLAQVPDEVPLPVELEGACRELERVLSAQRSSDDLLAAIHAQLDDDGPREVYADHLLDRGDPRGELIALQLRGAHSPEAARRERELLRAHEKEWLGPLVAVTKQRVWQRGFLVACKLTIPNQRSLRVLGDAIGWRTVERVDLEFTGALPLLLGPALAQLREIRGLAVDEAMQLLDARAPNRLRFVSVRVMNRDSLEPLFEPVQRALGVLGFEEYVNPPDLARLWTTPLGVQLDGLSVRHGITAATEWLAQLAETNVTRLIFDEPGCVIATRAPGATRWRFELDATAWDWATARAIGDALAVVPSQHVESITVAAPTPRDVLEDRLAAHLVVWR